MTIHKSKNSMVFKTWLSDINKVALAIDGLKGIRIAGTIDKLNPKSLNAFVKGIDGLTLSQAQAALSTKVLTDKQKEQILVSAGLLKISESVTASEIKQTVTENILTAEKQQEVLATFELDMSEGKLNLERLEAIALEDTEAGAIARVILAKRKENAENLKSIASGKSLLKVLKGQLTTLATNPLTWAIGAFAGITAVAIKSAEAIEKVREKANELGNEFSTSKSDIDGYKTQIEDLYKTINDSNSSVEDITTARQTLMTVQDELIDKFGKEKETIDLVTDAINGQSSALDILTQKKWQETKNKFNESDFWTGVGNWSQGYESNIDRMVDEMENPVVRIGMSINDFEIGEYTEVIQQMEKLGWTYSNTLSAFTKDGSLEDLYEEILSIQNNVDENAPAHFLEELTTEANKAKVTLDSYGSMWDNYILNDKIFADVNLADSWKEVNDAYTKYQNAVTSGDKTAIEEAISGFATSVNEVLNDENVSDSVKDYFKDMYPALYREVEKWEFKTNIIPEFDISGLEGKNQADILEMLQTEGIQEGEEEFNNLLLEAKEYGLISDTNTEGINNLLNYLVQWKILQGEINDTASEYEIGEGFTSTIVSSIQQIATQLEPQFAKLGEAYKSIFTEDGFTLENVDNPMLEDLRTTFSEIGEEIGVAFDSNHLEPFFDSLTNGTATADQVQQAFNDVATAYFYSTDTLDKLNDATAEAIQKQLQELGVINAKEVVYDTLATKTEALALEEQFLTANGYSLAEATNMKAMMFLNEAGASETARQYLFQLVATEQIFNNQDLNAKQKIEELESLAIAYGQTAIAAKIANMEKAAEAGHTQIDYDKELKSLQAHLNDGMSQVKVDFKQIDTNASSAGKDAAEEYKEALEEELSNLGDVISYVGDIIGDQIDLWEDQKDAAVDALEAERDAAIEALEAEKDRIQLKIDGIQAEIDAIKSAREERELQIESEKKLYNLHRQMNQKTRLVNYKCQTL